MGPRSTSIVELLNEVLDESNNSKKKKYPQALKTVTYISKILKYIHFWGKTKNNTYIWNAKTYFFGAMSDVVDRLSGLSYHTYHLSRIYKCLQISPQLFPNPNDIFHITHPNTNNLFFYLAICWGFSANIWNTLESSFENLQFEIL